MDEVNWVRFLLAFVFVLGLIGLMSLMLKRWGGRWMGVRMVGSQRLKVVEACPLGPRHRLVLVARDDVQHLLLVGPDGSIVVESGIRNVAH